MRRKKRYIYTSQQNLQVTKILAKNSWFLTIFGCDNGQEDGQNFVTTSLSCTDFFISFDLIADSLTIRFQDLCHSPLHGVVEISEHLDTQ